MASGVLRFDRYLAREGTLVDLATGAVVECRWRRGADGPALFALRGDRVLIDHEPRRRGRFEIWERRWAGETAHVHTEVARAFVEALDSARHGAPRLFRMHSSDTDHATLVRHLARDARQRGWVPIAASQLTRVAGGSGGFVQRWPRWLDSRSLVIFLSELNAHHGALDGLSRLAARDARPHLLVRIASGTDARVGVLTCHDQSDEWGTPSNRGLAVRELHAKYGDAGTGTRALVTAREARARWMVMLMDVLADRASAEEPTLDLARTLIRSGQTFEARALLGTAQASFRAERRRARLIALVNRASRTAAAQALGRGSEMVDDFVGVLQVCQDTEDERVALSRVGAYVRERLQASSVAFVVRDGPSLRTLATAGLHQAEPDAALTAIESGCAVAAPTDYGPTESAAPVRYAADVIGALWARWSAGVPVSRNDASALLGVAAVAAAPSLRGVLDRERPSSDAAVPELVGESPGIRSVREAVIRAAQSPFPVLIEGESGVGKELVARAIHRGSSRRDRRFSAVNCAALVDDLVEAELFGHVRGSFTSAHVDRPGLFEEVSGGTLFLDEVAELGTRVQAKLLRTLQEGEVRRIGESMTRRVDVRIVAATNRPLAAEVTGGRFRRDLWYRLDVIRIAIPPIRERLEDIPLLVRHAWVDLSARTGSRATLSASLVAALATYDWPGNVRELQNVLASMLVSAPRRGVIGPSRLPTHIVRATALTPANTLDAARTQFETRFVRAALARANGRTAVAARELGVSRQGLAKILTRLGLGPSGGSPAHM